jgi:hypothetical protein
LTWRALTSSTVKPRDSSNSNRGIQYTPVDSIATVSTPQRLNQSAMASRSSVKLGNSRTGCSSRSAGTAAKCEAQPTSMPAAFGWVIVKGCLDVAGLTVRLRLRRTIICSIIQLNVAPHRVRRLAHSLKRDAARTAHTANAAHQCR